MQGYPYLQNIVIVSSEEVDASKPDPAVFNEALRRLECTDNRNAVIFEDSLKGI